MAQTPEGAKKARETNIKRHGSVEAWKQFMRANAAIAGRASTTGGFGQGEEGRARARKYGAMGGRISRRTKKVVE